jgi:undecaprenyl diphosphate synthase
MTLLVHTIRKEVKELNKNNVQLLTFGSLEDLPEDARKAMEEAKEVLKNNTGLKLNLALSYSGRSEILHAINRLLSKGVSHVDENVFSQELYTAAIPDPELLIRTSGESRISNFLLWQLAYTEIHVSQVLWPDFREKELLEAIADYQKRERRFGKVSEQLQNL